ncbi:proline dehydrogenase [Micromonospora tulbaghiae]|uniref:proline dehydrogenase n=1 Tax=Micromonospora tulbaghiae TaxID=479978 RepID=A0A386WFP7_9ACTN|nr:proline dehydrogenase family protein [Micromonospora tulbaghiae]AYF26913.1 proline dehydrogenase [Micromonospora tulbaghiae]
MPNKLLLMAAASDRLRGIIAGSSLGRGVARRFVAGEVDDEVIVVARRIINSGMQVTIDHLGEGAATAEQATAVRDAYLSLLPGLRMPGMAEVSVKLSALGSALPNNGRTHAYQLTRDICAAAAAVDATVTIDMEDHTTVDLTLSVLNDLRAEFPWVGVALQACLHRTLADCRRLAVAGSRVRLVKGAYAEPSSVAYVNRPQIDKAFDRCLQVLMEGEGYPMVATHDPRLIERAVHHARSAGRGITDFEFQMLYGIRTNEQRRLAEEGYRVRVYLPYGRDWYAYFTRRLAEKPANLLLLARSFKPGAAN